MIRRTTRNIRRNERNARPAVRNSRSVITRRGTRRLDNEAMMARRNRRFRRYEEDEKEEKEAENLIDVAEVSAIVDKAVDALAGYDCPEKEYDDEEKEELPENEAICIDADKNEIPVSVDEENAKLIIELGDEATVEVALDQPEEDVDAELAESLEEFFNPEDEEDEDEDKDDKEEESAEERRIRRQMRSRVENFKRRQALRRREEAVKRFRRAQAIKRIRDERREETKRPAGRTMGRRVEGRKESRTAGRIGNLRRPGTRGRR